MNLDEDIFRTLQTDLEVCLGYIKQVSTGMLRSDVTKYPIFVATRGEADIDLGLPVINRNDFDISWNFSASHLEEFVTKGVILHEKANDFIKTFKSPAEFVCVFVAEETSGSFVFMPYQKDLSVLN